MTQAELDQLLNIVSGDPALSNEPPALTLDEAINRVMAYGAKAGFSFTRDEAENWVKAQTEAPADEELSDVRLEAVAGGKEGDPPPDYSRGFGPGRQALPNRPRGTTSQFSSFNLLSRRP